QEEQLRQGLCRGRGGRGCRRLRGVAAGRLPGDKETRSQGDKEKDIPRERRLRGKTPKTPFLISFSPCLLVSLSVSGVHSTHSLIGWAVFSTMRMGRPTFDMFSLRGSMPNARQTV